MPNVNIHDLCNKVGGRFKLAILITKRMVELGRGMPKVTDFESDDLMEIVLHEIAEDRIRLISVEVEPKSA